MKSEKMVKVAINLDLLKQELDNLKIVGFNGFMYSDGVVLLTFEDPVTVGDIDRVKAVVVAHDPLLPSDDFKKRDKRLKLIKQLTKKYPDVIDPTLFPAEWLEVVERIQLLETKMQILGGE